VTDAGRPVVRGQHRFLNGEWTFFERDRLLWDPQSGTLAFPAIAPTVYTNVDADGDGIPETEQWRQDHSLQVFQVGSGGELEFRGQAIHPREVLWSLLMGDVLYSVSEATLRASPLAQPSTTLGEADYNRAYVGRQLNPFQPGQDALLVIGGYEVDRFELEPLPNGQLEVRRAGDVFGRYDLTGIRQIVASDPQHYTDRVLVKKLEAMPASVDVESLQYRLELGDANRDGVVNLSDLALLKSQLGRQGAKWAADIDRDGDVDGADLEFMRSNFGGKIQYALYFDEIVLEDGTIGRAHQMFSALAIDAALAAESG
jgi:hypothetical protein